MMKRKFLLIVFLSFGINHITQADEGTWIPSLIKNFTINDMQANGLRLTAEEIYSVNNSSLKDAIVHFGGGCTAEMISSKGLILTNHHCGYSRIQSHSSVENDLLTNGFWADNLPAELKNPGLTATFIIRIEDVTNEILKNINSSMTENERDSIIKVHGTELEKNAIKGTHYKSFVRPFYYGNEFYLFVTETFLDVRLVGAPPSAIGKFGGDTDNWMWPRHTGDFSLFRIYANAENKPAEFSEGNKPYSPKHFLPVSIKGIKEGDFTMVYGFPGRTQEYITSHAVDQIINISNPQRIKLREIRLQEMDKFMKQSDAIRIQYSAKQSSVSNAWKKWIGENRGLLKLNAIEQKRELEKEFAKWVQDDPQRINKYGNLLEEFSLIYNKQAILQTENDYINDAALGVELLTFAFGYMNFVELSEKKETKQEELKKAAVKMQAASEGFFKNYHMPMDRSIFPPLMKLLYENTNPAFQPEYLKELHKKYNGDFYKIADYVYSNSIFASQEKLNRILSNYKKSSMKKIKRDPAFRLSSGLITNYRTLVSPVYRSNLSSLDSLYRIYMTGLREMQTTRKFYPDANSTLRISYGKAEGYIPFDGAEYHVSTTLSGKIEKGYLPVEDYVMPPKLLKLFQEKDFGEYGVNGTMPVCFIASNHTTGGNSGSPVLNGDGHLIGINFDRNWEGTMSDIMYDKTQVRNISVDVRYILFIIDKYAGAGYLLDEMKIIK
ncbi:MAG: S46 family peptidase [Bacteroidia bacterium]